MKQRAMKIFCISCFIIINVSCKSNDAFSAKEFVKKNKNNSCISSFFGTRVFNRGNVYFINIPKYNDYLLAFRQIENGEIKLIDSAVTHYSTSNIKKPITDSIFQKVNMELDYFRYLINCYNALNVSYINSYKEKFNGIIEFFIINDIVIYYIPSIEQIDSAQKEWLKRNSAVINEQWFWYKKKTNTHKSIWEATPL